jgi:phosphonate transport system substrate-binding protein
MGSLLAVGCSRKAGPLGSAGNPIRMAVVPSLESQKLVISGKALAQLLEKRTGYHYEVSVPTSYAAVIAALGSGKVDMAWLAPLSYVVAHDRYGAKVLLISIRSHSKTYEGFILVRSDSGINSLADLKGKKFAYVDPLSTSGCVYPKLLLLKHNYNPERFFSQVVYAGGHDTVVMDVYKNKVDGGAIYGGPVSDAREKVKGIYKDVLSKTKVIAKTDPIPNDVIAVRKDLPYAVAGRIRSGLLAVAKSDEGRQAVLALYGIDSLAPTDDSQFDSVRQAAKAVGINIEQELMKKK